MRTTNFFELVCPVAAIVAALTWATAAVSAEPTVARSAEAEQARAYAFSEADHALLESIQRGCFNYFWNEVGDGAKLARDYTGSDKASMAGIGFQLSSLPIGVTRGWVSRDEGEQRALTILRALSARDDIRRDGVFRHFVRPDDAAPYVGRHRPETSTVDHSLLLAGAAPAAAFFGGEVAALVDRLIDETDWRAYLIEDGRHVSMAFKPAPPYDLSGPGEIMTHHWWGASAEERLVYALAVASSNPDHALPPESYYQLVRDIKTPDAGRPFAVSWSGSLFTYFFSHCWINYAGLRADAPADFGSDEPPVDWFENSRRATLAHRTVCLANGSRFKTFGGDRWGQAPCYGFGPDGERTYLVPSTRPNMADEQRLCGGTVAPYAAGATIVFTPAESLAALRAFVALRDASGKPLVWDDPLQGGVGLRDSFNLDSGRAFDGGVAIDAGPMLLAIENARTGLIWELFSQHPMGERMTSRLGWRRR